MLQATSIRHLFWYEPFPPLPLEGGIRWTACSSSTSSLTFRAMICLPDLDWKRLISFSASSVNSKTTTTLIVAYSGANWPRACISPYAYDIPWGVGLHGMRFGRMVNATVDHVQCTIRPNRVPGLHKSRYPEDEVPARM